MAILVSDDSPSSLIGTEGDDILVGGIAGPGDTLAPGGGDNLVALGDQAATIQVSKSGETDEVYGFGNGDVLLIVDPTSPREVHQLQQGDDVVLQIGGLGGQGANHSTVTLHDVALSNLHAGVDSEGHLQISFVSADLNPLG